MAQRRDRRRGSLLDALPAELRAEVSPERCVCRSCEPFLTDVERTSQESTERRWRAARKAWCLTNGYRLLDLLRAERHRGAPSKRRPDTKPNQAGRRPPTGEPNPTREK